MGTIKKTISASGASGSGTLAETGICDYEYTCSGGKLIVTVSNLSEATRVNANVGAIQTDVTLNLKVNVSAPNSLLVLALFNGDKKVGEYGFTYNENAQTASVTLPKNTTIKILATKPFGSRIELLLDGTALTPVGVTSYEVPMGTATRTLSVTLTGSGGWSNMVVV